MIGAYPPLSGIDPFLRADGLSIDVAIGIGPLYCACDPIRMLPATGGVPRADLVIWFLSDRVAAGVLDSVGGSGSSRQELQDRYAKEMGEDPRWAKAVQDVVDWCSLVLVMVQ